MLKIILFDYLFFKKKKLDSLQILPCLKIIQIYHYFLFSPSM